MTLLSVLTLATLLCAAAGCTRSVASDVSSSTKTRPEPRTALDEPPLPPPVTSNPFAGARLFVDPNSSAMLNANALRTSEPENAALLERIAQTPQAVWFGDWNSDVFRAADELAKRAEKQGALPVIVAYNVPRRDAAAAAEGVCHSCGGQKNQDAYRRWIRALRAGLGSRRAVVVLEPDALPGIESLSAEAQEERLFLLRDAILVLRQSPGTAVYIDAGNPAWVPVARMAELLRAAGVEHAHGFTLNVSNYRTTEECLDYGRKLSALTHGKHFVIDTSRNGAGPYAEAKTDYESWCNPPGRKLGAPPTVETGDALADAFLWLKHPGESDGECAGGPRAGTFWPEMARELAR